MRGLWRSKLVWSACTRPRLEPNPILRKQFSQAAAAAEACIDPAGDLTRLREDLAAQPGKSVELVDEWRSRGHNNLTSNNVSELFQHLSHLKQGKEALRLVSHVRKLNLVPLTPDICIRELTMASLVYHETGVQRSYDEFPSELKTEEVTAALIANFVKNKALIKAQPWVKKLIRKMKVVESYNAIMSFYLAKDMHEHILAVYARMKKSTVKPNAETYLHLFNCRRRVGGLPSIEDEAREALKDIDVEEVTDKVLLNHIVEVYGHVGETEKVDRTWKRLKFLSAAPGTMYLDSYNAGFTAFHLVGETEKAKEVAEEMVEYKRTRVSPYFSLIDMYARLGMFEKAEEVIVEKDEGKKAFSNALMLHHLKNKETEKALEIFDGNSDKAVNLASYELVMGLLTAFAAEKNFKRASKLMNQYITLRHGDIHLFNKLLEVYVATGRKPDKLVKDEFPFIVPNEKTLLLLMQAEFSGRP